MCFFNGSFNELGVIAMSVFNIYIYIYHSHISIQYIYIHHIFTCIHRCIQSVHSDFYSSGKHGWLESPHVQKGSYIFMHPPWVHISQHPCCSCYQFWEILKWCQHYFLPSQRSKRQETFAGHRTKLATTWGTQPFWLKHLDHNLFFCLQKSTIS